ncbi:MAG: type II toxin-antitoxin system HicA family toxin [Syntrophomonadaceae bacterium]|nr:type II toxin-antitoxin system HicA family toxin [Syntrophomonadaceae bacterium]
MTPKLPVVFGLECIRVLEKVGYKVVRQKSSHTRLKDINGKLPPVTVPDHKGLHHKELRPGLLRKILKDAELTVEEFIQLYK